MDNQKIWACISVNTKADGIVAVKGKDGWMPLVVVTEKLLPMITELAVKMSTDLGITIHVVEFCNPTVIQVIEPIEQNIDKKETEHG